MAVLARSVFLVCAAVDVVVVMSYVLVFSTLSLSSSLRTSCSPPTVPSRPGLALRHDGRHPRASGVVDSTRPPVGPTGRTCIGRPVAHTSPSRTTPPCLLCLVWCFFFFSSFFSLVLLLLCWHFVFSKKNYCFIKINDSKLNKSSKFKMYRYFSTFLVKQVTVKIQIQN